MALWVEIGSVIDRASLHFENAVILAGRLPGHLAGSLDAYVDEMALRHALQCGEADIGVALAILRREHAKGAGYSLLSPEVRSAYLALRALTYVEFSEPSSVDDELLRPAIEGAGVMAERLRTDFERVRRETGDA